MSQFIFNLHENLEEVTNERRFRREQRNQHVIRSGNQSVSRVQLDPLLIDNSSDDSEMESLNEPNLGLRRDSPNNVLVLSDDDEIASIEEQEVIDIFDSSDENENISPERQEQMELDIENEAAIAENIVLDEQNGFDEIQDVTTPEFPLWSIRRLTPTINIHEVYAICRSEQLTNT